MLSLKFDRQSLFLFLFMFLLLLSHDFSVSLLFKKYFYLLEMKSDFWSRLLSEPF